MKTSTQTRKFIGIFTLMSFGLLSIAIAKTSQKTKPRSKEWQNLPKQSWETFHFPVPPEIDPMGFDKNSKIIFKKTTGFEAQSIPASEKLNYLGQIVGARSEGQYLGINDTVYIRADDAAHPLVVGESYAVTQEPQRLKFKASDRIGYSYPYIGKVKIIGVRSGLYVGTLLFSRNFLERGASLLPLPPPVPVLDAIPGTEALKAEVAVDPTFSTSVIFHNKEVFIDRGTEDGIKPGMVFRSYQHYDPSNDKKVTTSNVIIDADIQITQVSEIISTALVIHSRSPITAGTPVILVTSPEELKNKSDFTAHGPLEESEDEEAMALDLLDSRQPISPPEKKVLKQLETFTPDTSPAPVTEPSATPSPVPSASPSVIEASPLPQAVDNPQNSPAPVPSSTEASPMPNGVLPGSSPTSETPPTPPAGTEPLPSELEAPPSE